MKQLPLDIKQKFEFSYNLFDGERLLSLVVDHILTNSRETISQSGVINIGISDHQLIHLTRKLHRIKLNTHKQIKIRSLKNYSIESLNQGLSMINFPDYEYFNDVDIAYSDFIQRITLVINKIAPFREIRIKNYSHDWFDGEILDKIFSGINVSRNLWPLDLIMMNSCIKKQK